MAKGFIGFGFDKGEFSCLYPGTFICVMLNFIPKYLLLQLNFEPLSFGSVSICLSSRVHLFLLSSLLASFWNVISAQKINNFSVINGL